MVRRVYSKQATLDFRRTDMRADIGLFRDVVECHRMKFWTEEGPKKGG